MTHRGTRRRDGDPGTTAPAASGRDNNPLRAWLEAAEQDPAPPAGRIAGASSVSDDSQSPPILSDGPPGVLPAERQTGGHGNHDAQPAHAAVPAPGDAEFETSDSELSLLADDGTPAAGPPLASDAFAESRPSRRSLRPWVLAMIVWLLAVAAVVAALRGDRPSADAPGEMAVTGEGDPALHPAAHGAPLDDDPGAGARSGALPGQSSTAVVADEEDQAGATRPAEHPEPRAPQGPGPGVPIEEGSRSAVAPSGAAAPGDDGGAAGDRGAAPDPQIGAVAVVAVRLHETHNEDGRARYVDMAMPTALRWQDDIAVVTVTAVVLDGIEGRWESAQVVRYAVPVGRDGGAARALAPPWPVEVVADDRASAPVPDRYPEAAADPTLLRTAITALEAAGYEDIQTPRARVSPDLPAGVASVQVHARAPGDPRPRTHTLWVRTDDSPQVLGAEP